MTSAGSANEPRWLLPRGLIVLLSMAGLLVSILALQQFAGILAPVLLALVLVIGFHPLIGILRRRGAPMWPAVTLTSVIQPKFVADAVDLSLTLTFLSLIFWSFVIGPLGAVLATPLTLLSTALLLDVDPTTRWMSSLVSGGPAPPDDDIVTTTPEPEPEGAPGSTALVGEGN